MSYPLFFDCIICVHFLIPVFGKIAVPICLPIFPLTPSIVRPLLFHFFSIPHNTIFGQTTFSYCDKKKKISMFFFILLSIFLFFPRNAIGFFISQPYLYHIPILYCIILGCNKEILCYVIMFYCSINLNVKPF